MVFVDRTHDFRELCLKQKRPEPTKKRRGRGSEEPTSEQVAAKAYVAEGYTIMKHITTLNALLNSVKRPYLNVDVQPTYSRQARNFDLASGKPDAFAGIKSLTNEERDQIDYQARLVLGKCADRVKEMEVLEQRRQEALAARANPLARFLPARLLGDTAAFDFVAAHRTNITWYLTRRLADASQLQKEMQEERIKRQQERAKTLGSSAAMYGAGEVGRSPSNGLDSWGMGAGASSGFAALTGSFMGGPKRPEATKVQSPPLDDSSDEEDLELTPGQILQFEQENAAILRQVEDTLAAVQQAEARLMDISALQTELVVQLQRQSEIVDHLYDDAIATQGEVEKGHVQLKQARDRARESRKWLLAFILGATFAMLFLHWYD